MEKQKKMVEAVKTMTRIGVAFSYDDAWGIANEIVNGDYDIDEARSEAAGHVIYVSTSGDWISELNDRLEVNYEKGAKSVNVWIQKN